MIGTISRLLRRELQGLRSMFRAQIVMRTEQEKESCQMHLNLECYCQLDMNYDI